MERPLPILKTLAEETIGALGYAHNLKLNLKFNEVSQLSFDLPRQVDGVETPYYRRVTAHKLIQLDPYGKFILSEPTIQGDGVREVKSCTARSLEQELDNSNLFLEEGTYNFWNPLSTADTVLSRILEAAPGWTVGEVAPSLVGRYRTFDQVDAGALSFVYGECQTAFECVFLFDPYLRQINVLDAAEEVPTLPIWLSWDNLLKSQKVTEKSDELVTVLNVYGAEGVSAAEVNPLGTPALYDLRHFVQNGDLPPALAEKWTAWETQVAASQEHYVTLVSLRASATARLLAERARLADLKNELKDLDNQRSVTIQAQAKQETQAQKEEFQQTLRELNLKYGQKEAELRDQQALLDGLEEEKAEYQDQIDDINLELNPRTCFEAGEYEVLRKFFLESSLTEGTFAVYDVDYASDGAAASLPQGALELTCGTVEKVWTDGDRRRDLYTVEGGRLTLGSQVEADVVRGTVEHSTETGALTCSFYLGAGVQGEDAFPGGTLVLTGLLDGPLEDRAAEFAAELSAAQAAYGVLREAVREAARSGALSPETQAAVDALPAAFRQMLAGEGGRPCTLPLLSDRFYAFLRERRETYSLTLPFREGRVYVTANATDYQRFSVALDLYRYGREILADKSTPTYEFSVDSGNFLFLKEFLPFRNALELGCAVYLQLDEETVIRPVVIEAALDFEKESSFSLIFSNTFKRPDQVNTLKEMIEKSYASSRSLDASKYNYGAFVQSGGYNEVRNYITSALDASKNAVLAGSGQNIRIDDTGITVGAGGSRQIRMVDSMLAFTDDGWQSAKLGLGEFYDPNTGSSWGLAAPNIVGTLVAGEQFVFENTAADGITKQFRFDSTGAWLNNSTLLMQNSAGGKLLLDPRWGLLAGNGSLYTTNGTTITPSFVDDAGGVTLDRDGFPTNANFYLDARDGSAYFRGRVVAQSGLFQGVVQADDFLDPSGKSMMNGGKFDSEFLDLGNIKLDGQSGDITMTGNISMDGSITLGGSINLSGASSITWGGNSPVKSQFSSDNSNWHDTMQASDRYRRDWDWIENAWGASYQFKGVDGRPGSDASVTFASVREALYRANGIQHTFITATEAGAPNIYSANIYGANIYAGDGTQSYSTINKSGFYLYFENTSIPKALIESIDNGGTVQLMLGSGSNSSYPLRDRLRLQKIQGTAGLIYQDSNGKDVGFTFDSNGITVLGDLQATARFG